MLTKEEVIRKAMASILEFEGSEYTNDPDDAGGPTKWGVSLVFNKNVIPDKNKDGRITAEDVKQLTKDDAIKIFKQRYWDTSVCDKLPLPLAFEYVDMVVNPGPGAAPVLLQKALNKLGNKLAIDGKVGPMTLRAVAEADQAKLIKALSDERIAYYKTRPKFWKYGKGWTIRANKCCQSALSLLGTTA